MSYLARISQLEVSQRRDWIVGSARVHRPDRRLRDGSLPFSMTETLGFVTGAASVWLLVRESIWNFPAGIVNGVFYLVLFANARFFADSALQIVFIGLGIFGWWWWLRGRSGRAPRPIERIGLAEAAVARRAHRRRELRACSLYLRSIGDAAPLADAVTTALSLAASWMQARKQIENWAVWIAADAIYIPLYFVKSLPLTGVLYAIFALMCVKGWRDWSRTLAAHRSARRWGRGVVIGKFHPFHSGHRHLIETARRPRRRGDGDRRRPRSGDEPPGELRARWIEEAFPEVRVVLLDQDAVGPRRATTAPAGPPRRSACSAERPTSASPPSATAIRGRRRWAATTSSSTAAGAPSRSAARASAAIRSRTWPSCAAARAATTSSASACSAPRAPARRPSPGRLADQLRHGLEPRGRPHVLLVPRRGPDRLGHVADGGVRRDREPPELVRGLPRRLRRPRPLLRHECLDDRALPRDLPRRALARGRRPREGREYDLYILCDPETPFAQDELGIRVDGPHRRRMHEAYLAHVQETGAPYVVVSGTHAERMAAACCGRRRTDRCHGEATPRDQSARGGRRARAARRARGRAGAGRRAR